MTSECPLSLRKESRLANCSEYPAIVCLANNHCIARRFFSIKNYAISVLLSEQALLGHRLCLQDARPLSSGGSPLSCPQFRSTPARGSAGVVWMVYWQDPRSRLGVSAQIQWCENPTFQGVGNSVNSLILHYSILLCANVRPSK